MSATSANLLAALTPARTRARTRREPMYVVRQDDDALASAYEAAMGGDDREGRKAAHRAASASAPRMVR